MGAHGLIKPLGPRASSRKRRRSGVEPARVEDGRKLVREITPMMGEKFVVNAAPSAKTIFRSVPIQNAFFAQLPAEFPPLSSVKAGKTPEPPLKTFPSQ